MGGKSGQFSVTVGIGFLSLFPLCAMVTEEEGQKKRENLVENEITSHEGVHWCRISRTFLMACVPLLTLLSRFAN